MSAGPAPSPVLSTADRILDAWLEAVVDTGLRRATMGDVARRAGLARVTLYQHFPNKDALIRAGWDRESERFLADIRRAIRGHRDPEERLVHAFARAYRGLRNHPLLNRMLDRDADLLLPVLLGNGEVAQRTIGSVAEELRRGTAGTAWDGLDALAAAEITVRLLQSLLFSPATGLGLDRPGGPRAFARGWFVPALRLLVDAGPGTDDAA